MFIDKTLWNKLVEKFNEVYKNYDYFSDDTQELIDDVDICIEKIKQSSSDKIYVITNNAVVDDEIDYCIYDVTTNKEQAKDIFKCAVHDAKIDADFENINAIDVNDDSQSHDQEEWYYDETDNSFELYLNGEYNSNNFSIQIKEYDINQPKEYLKLLDEEKGMEL